MYNMENRCLLWAIRSLVQEGIEKIDAVNLSAMLSSNAAVKKKIKEYNIGEIEDFIAMSSYAARHTIEEYKLLVKRVVTLSYKRDLLKTLEEVKALALNDSAQLTEIDAMVSSKLNELTQSYIVANEVENYGDKIDEIWEEIKKRRQVTDAIPNKYPLLGQYFSFEPGELYLISARMKMGKSALFLNYAQYLCEAGVPTLYLDTEMSDVRFSERLISNISGVEVSKVRDGNYSREEESRIMAAIQRIKKYPFVHLFIPDFTDEQVFAVIKILKYKMNLKFVIYDYIKGNTTSSSELYNILGARCDKLKEIAGIENIPILAGAQLNRENRVADSDKLERYVTVSMYWRQKTQEEEDEEGPECGNFCMNVALNRMGEQMDSDEKINFKFDGNRMRITEAKQYQKKASPFD